MEEVGKVDGGDGGCLVGWQRRHVGAEGESGEFGRGRSLRHRGWSLLEKREMVVWRE